jgi:hypothetical protein
MIRTNESRPIAAIGPWNSKRYAGVACDDSSNILLFVASHSVTPGLTAPSHSTMRIAANLMQNISKTIQFGNVRFDTK